MRTCLALVVLVVSIVLSGAAPAAQDHPAPAVPGVRPSARFSLLFLQYRRLDADSAIDALSKWKEAEVIAEAVASPNDDAWTRAALVSFLTETGMRKGTFGQFADASPKSILLTGWGLDKNFEVFSFRGYSLVKDLTRVARSRHDDRLLKFCSRWYATATSYALRYRRYAREGLQAMADHDLNEVADVPLLVGSYYESVDGPFVPTATAWCFRTKTEKFFFEGPDGCMYDPPPCEKCPPNPKREALWGFQSALAIDPNSIEAHLRLGRFLHLLNRNVEARQHLERALADALEQHVNFVAYMAGLFLGELDEHENRLTEAVAHFRIAVSADPTGHTANIALGEAMLRSGDTRGWAEARHMFDDESQDQPKKLDPWFFYRFAQYWRIPADLRDMRQIARSVS